jgi:hypothetical protein
MTAIELPKKSPVVDAIYAYHKKRGDSEKQRRYLGMSEIGGPCERKLWYSFRHCFQSSFDGRMRRLFETGQLAEARFVSELRAIGCTVYDVDESGRQFAFSDIGGHFAGHMDGCILGIPGSEKTWAVLEFKTHGSKSYAKLVKEGVLHSKPQHYAQCQCYMNYSGMTRALYLAVNKDTDELYTERVHFDKLYYDTLIERANRVISSNALPERISTREDWYECSWCDAHAVCWGSPGPALQVPALSCRQCCHATATMDGNAAWKCEKFRKGLSDSDQSRACSSHLTLPVLLQFAEPIDYEEDGIECIERGSADENRKWVHGGKGFSSKDLMQLSPDQLINETVKAAVPFDVTVTSASPDDIISRYPTESNAKCEAKVIWSGVYGLLRENWLRLYGESLLDLDPIMGCCGFDYQATEYAGGRCVILWTMKKKIGEVNCEIRECIPF